MFHKLTILILLLFSSFVNAQNAASKDSIVIKGTVVDEHNAEPIPFVCVVLLKDSIKIASSQTDFDGNFTFKTLKKDYKLKFVSIGYKNLTTTAKLNNKRGLFKLSSKACDEDQTTIIVRYYPIIEKDNTSNGQTFTKEELNHFPY